MLPVFLINLERSTERLQKSSEELKKFGISFTRVPAVDGASLTEADKAKWLAPDYSGYYKKLAAAELGCYLSHIHCWQTIVEQKIESAVILEDDFELQENFVDVVEQMKSAPIEWDCVKLTEHPIKRKARFTVKHGASDLIVYDKIPSRTGAYIISLEGAKKMLAGSQTISRPIDIEFQYWWKHEMKVWGVKPYPVNVALGSGSTIDSMTANRKKAPKRFSKQFTEGMAFALTNLWKTKRWVKELERQSL